MGNKTSKTLSLCCSDENKGVENEIMGNEDLDGEMVERGYRILNAPEDKYFKEDSGEFTVEDWKFESRIVLQITPLRMEEEESWLFWVDENDTLFDIKWMVYLKKRKRLEFHPDNLVIAYAGRCNLFDQLRVGNFSGFNHFSILHIIPIHELSNFPLIRKDYKKPNSFVYEIGLPNGFMLTPPIIRSFTEKSDIRNIPWRVEEAVHPKNPFEIRFNRSLLFPDDDDQFRIIAPYSLKIYEITEHDNAPTCPYPPHEFNELNPLKRLVYVCSIPPKKKNANQSESEWDEICVCPKNGLKENTKYMGVVTSRYLERVRFEFITGSIEQEQEEEEEDGAVIKIVEKTTSEGDQVI